MTLLHPIMMILCIVSQIGSLKSGAKCFKTHGSCSDAQSEDFPSILLVHLNAMVSHFKSTHADIPFSKCLNELLDFAAVQSIIDKQTITLDGISIDGIFSSDDPLAFAASTKYNPDILLQAQMLRASVCDQFLESQHPEIQGLCNADVFKFYPISSLPSGSRLLNTIWSYRCKHHPTDHVLLKHKSCLCIDGSQQQYGVEYWEMYAPVVHWSTV